MRTHAGLGASGEPPPARGGQTCDQAPAHAVLPVTNRYKSRHPTSTRPAVTANAARLDPTTPRPRRARRPPGWPDTRIAAAGQAGCGIPPASPKGYHTAAQGQSHMTHAPVPSRAAPGPPRGWAAPGRRDATPAAAGKISYPAAPLRSLVVKHLTGNQVLGDRTPACRSQRPRRAPAYINWYINGY
jgi:hypothetical protein